jgi:hypothetical protein
VRGILSRALKVAVQRGRVARSMFTLIDAPSLAAWDNAFMESFSSPIQPHSSLDYHSPVEHERLHTAAQTAV